MQYTICADHCDSFTLCSDKHKKSCPKLTQQTMYIIKYLAQQSEMGNTIYPHSGTWQDQPQYYILAYSIAVNQMNKIRKGKNQ